MKIEIEKNRRKMKMLPVDNVLPVDLKMKPIHATKPIKL